MSFVDALSSIMSGSGMCVSPLIGGNGQHGFVIEDIYRHVFEVFKDHGYVREDGEGEAPEEFYIGHYGGV